MNRLLTALLIASLAGPTLAAPAAAGPAFGEEPWLVARKAGNPERLDERDWRPSKQSSDKKKQERVEDDEEKRGYGYGYERRGFDRPDRMYDDRGRR